MKKLFALLVLPIVATISLVGVSYGQLAGIDNPYKTPTNEGGSTNVNAPGAGLGQQDSFVSVIKGAINWILGILALIALIILLWGGFQMVTAAGDEEKYKKGFTILKQAAIGLILIGVAWFVISIIFRLVNLTTTNATPDGSGG